MKKRLLVVLATVMLLTLTLFPAAAQAAEEFSIGETVEYFGKQWVVIGYNGNGVASSANTLTLLLANAGEQNMYATGNYFNKEVAYGTGQRTYFDITEPRSSEYAGSDLQAAMDGAAATLSAAERAQLVPCNFEGGAKYKDGSGKVSGSAVTEALFWALSAAEAESLDASILDFHYNWWLRTVGENFLRAAEVTNAIGDDNSYKVFVSGSHISTPNAVRPACIINLAALVSNWAKSEIDKAEQLGLIPDSLKGQDLTKPITRAEFAAVAVKVYENLAATKAAAAAVNPFTDTRDAEVLKAFNTDLMVGTAADQFSPDVLLNREQAATALTRVFKRVTLPGWTYKTDADFSLEYTEPLPFADDAKISDWARDSVYFMAANGIITGIGENNFSPKAITDAEKAINYASATREQALVIAVRMVEKLK
ncbi:MAG: S-layer homology domain-containing protein [Oscillospiraceae bacterium]|nr:S-layer homology domain-containing protein [Oscillospiraceae bacterium]